jgi:HSP20 family protein
MTTETRNKHERASSSNEHPVQKASERSDLRRGFNQYSSGPFGLMRQMQDEVDRWFHRAGFDSGWASPSNWLSRAGGHASEWTPAIEAFQRGNEFVIRADVPGMSRQDLTVEIGDEAITISGERKHEEREERDGVFWTERSYGSFCRVVPLPPGAISDSAKATFSNGVLEVVTQAPSQDARRGRKVDISGRDEASKK